MSASERPATQACRNVAPELLDWLAGLLSAPMSVVTVAACRSRGGTALFDAIDDEFGRMPGIEAMRALLASDESDKQVAARLSGCYIRLFEGPGGPATVSLHESTYAGQGGRLQQQAATDMAAMLRRCDRTVRAGHVETPDHLSLEVALLATLLRVGDRVTAEELRQRLLRWAPRVMAACAATDPTGFYRGALSALHDTLTVLDEPISLRTCDERPC